MLSSMFSASLSSCVCSAVGAGGRWSLQPTDSSNARANRNLVIASVAKQSSSCSWIAASLRSSRWRAHKKRAAPRSGPSRIGGKLESLLVRCRVCRGVRCRVASSVERYIGVGRSFVAGGGIDVGRRSVLNGSLIRRVVGGFILVARGDAERQDRNGHDRKLLHESFTPLKCPWGGARPGLPLRVVRPGRRE